MVARRRYRVAADGKRHAVAVVDGHEGHWISWTSTCSGCFESADEHLYSYDPKARCKLGSGCHECGFTGKRGDFWWRPFDLSVLEALWV
jgi:hypothetical protein